MRGFSKAIITGNLTRDPEVRTTTSGAQVCSFSVAVNRTYKDGSGAKKEDVSFIDCSAWGRLAETIQQYAKKGDGVLVSGRLSQRSWEDKEGKKRSATEIVVEDFNFIGGGNREGGNSYASNFGAQNVASDMNQGVDEPAPDDIPESVSLDELPF